MKTATVRTLRHHFGNVLSWIEEGEPVRISKRGRAIAILQPLPQARRGRIKRPDFMTRLKKLYGNRVVSVKRMLSILDDNKGPH